MIKSPDIFDFLSDIKRWEERAELLTQEVGRGISALVFNTVVQGSPQFSGDFAANWKYSVGEPDTSFESAGLRGDELFDAPHGKGDSEAIEMAFTSQSGKEMQFKLGVPAYISNSAQHDELYAWKIWEGTIRFRPENPSVDLERDVKDALSAFAPGGLITKAGALALVGMRIGA